HRHAPERPARRRVRAAVDAGPLSATRRAVFGGARRVFPVRGRDVGGRGTVPPPLALYSAVLGVFVPSGGSKWVIEAPYVMSAAHTLKVHLGWVVSSYDLGEALANLVQPFWMLPVLGLFKLGARDVMGYTFVVFVALVPVVLALVTMLGLTLPYPL